MKRLFDGSNRKTEAWLHEVGIHSFADLEALGAVEAYKRLKARFPREVSLNALWGLQGALLNLHWNAIPPEMKAELKSQLEDTP
ncbi:MAG: TfoX/Sxy family protein [Anaerolineae bacterium]|nr:TfoX/Sxy family protein [Anaerolineae bacterium]